MSVAWRWLGGFTVRIEAGGVVLYIDPFRVRARRARRADVILITNPRVGHWSPEDVDRLRGPGTRIFGPAGLAGGAERGAETLRPGDEVEAAGLRIRAVPAANRELSFFPRAAGWLGYLVTAGGSVLYHAGATEWIPELEGLRADVAFLPVGGRIVMDEEEARRAAAELGARAAAALFLAGERAHPVPGFVIGSGRGGPRS